MENITRALILAFSMLMFVIGFSYSMYLINGLSTTSNVLLDNISTKDYYDNIEVSSDLATRDVRMETIVSTLYRYYKENYAVKIYVKNGSHYELLQIFDVNLETKIAKAAGYTKKDDEELVSLKKSIYNNKNSKAYLFEAPWTGNTDENTRTRIDYFLNGSKGYINNTEIDYSSTGSAFRNEVNAGFLKKYSNTTFTESFLEYAYSGETVSTVNGIETITGSTQENSKIIITYKEK